MDNEHDAHAERDGEEPIVDDTFAEFLEELPESPPPVEDAAEEVTEEETEETVDGSGEPEEEEEESGDEEAVEESEDDSEEEGEEEDEASEVDEEEDEDLDDEDSDDEPTDDPRIAALERQLAELKAAQEKKETPKEEPPPDLPDDLEARIFGDIDFDDAMADKKLFSQVITNALKVGRDITHEHVLRSIPNMVIQHTRGYHDLVQLNKRFYRKNKDLREFKETVVAAANEVHSENPELGMEDVLDKAAVRARRALKLSGKKASNKPQRKKQKPAFAKTPKKKTTVKKKVSKLQDDINKTLF